MPRRTIPAGALAALSILAIGCDRDGPVGVTGPPVADTAPAAAATPSAAVPEYRVIGANVGPHVFWYVAVDGPEDKDAYTRVFEQLIPKAKRTLEEVAPPGQRMPSDIGIYLYPTASHYLESEGSWYASWLSNNGEDYGIAWSE